jgi:DNA-binding CsgD family transcriptional regulator
MASCEQAAAVARRAGDAAALGRVAVLMPEVSSPDWLPLVEGWCSEALAGLPAGDSPLRAQLLAQQTLSLTFSGDVDEMDHGSAAALAMAARTGDDAALRHGLRARQMARSGPEGGAERAVLADRMQALGERTGDAGAVLWGHLWRFDTLVQQGRIDEAEAELDRLAVVVARGRPPLGRWHLARSRAALLAGRGRFAEALAAVDDAVRGAEWGQRHIALNSSHAARLLVAVLTGDELFEPRVGAAALHLPLPLGPLSQLAVAEWHLVHGRTDDAAGIYERLPPPSWRPPPFFRPTLTAYRGWVAAALGDAEGAAAAYEMLLPDADVHVASGAGVIITRGSVRYHLGASAAGGGRIDDAVDQLRRAVDANRASGLVPAAAEAQCRLAEVLLGRGRAGDHTAARAAASAAEATATRLGLRFVEWRARAVAAELHRAGPLSRREHEIAALVARGLTNRQIADEAHIAERTAENHVQHILTKLGFSTRTQIATWFTAGAGATAGAQPEPK